MARRKSTAETSGSEGPLPFDRSIGYQIRLTHRLVQRYLQQKIGPHGVTLGMWYFLRALWHEDGITQRELSFVVGTMEPTTLNAIKSMETLGMVRRVRNSEDRRKINIFLTPRGRKLEGDLMPLARDVVEKAIEGFAPSEIDALLRMLSQIQANVVSRTEEVPAVGLDADTTP
ncbi:MAG: MarR family winged helix-turn-helix transcriptional regulator [Hyphomicrobiales bacterium]|nr:MarR family winged helix-turn-helix transcriptional regulator [Hyphomicrobiales bacterium]